MKARELRGIAPAPKHPRSRPLLAVSIAPDVRAQVDKAAKTARISRSAMVEQLLREALGRRRPRARR